MSADLAASYAAALERNDVAALLASLTSDVVFRSPFSEWRDHAIPKVYRSRAVAVDGLSVDAVIEQDGRAVILWRATVAGEVLESSEILTMSEGAISCVDVFIRPAAVLDRVYRAMVAAWPRS